MAGYDNLLLVGVVFKRLFHAGKDEQRPPEVACSLTVMQAKPHTGLELEKASPVPLRIGEVPAEVLAKELRAPDPDLAENGVIPGLAGTKFVMGMRDALRFR